MQHFHHVECGFLSIVTLFLSLPAVIMEVVREDGGNRKQTNRSRICIKLSQWQEFIIYIKRYVISDLQLFETPNFVH